MCKHHRSRHPPAHEAERASTTTRPKSVTWRPRHRFLLSQAGLCCRAENSETVTRHCRRPRLRDHGEARALPRPSTLHRGPHRRSASCTRCKNPFFFFVETTQGSRGSRSPHTPPAGAPRERRTPGPQQRPPSCSCRSGRLAAVWPARPLRPALWALAASHGRCPRPRLRPPRPTASPH